MSQYQRQTVEVLESSGLSDMSEVEKQEMWTSVRGAMDKLLAEHKRESEKLTLNCTLELKEVVTQKMSAALSYGLSILNTGLGPYVEFINHVSKYGRHLQGSLDDCIDVYSPLFTSHIGQDHTHYMGSTSEVCMVLEVEGLIKFIREFVIEATKLLNDYTNSTSSDVMIETTPTPIPSQSVVTAGPSPTGNGNGILVMFSIYSLLN